MTARVRSAKSRSVRVKRPSGSPRRESNPAEITTRSVRNRSAAGISEDCTAPKISVRPEPAGNGKFIVVPTPAASPVSSARPVPGYSGHWCVLKKKTVGSE